MPKAQDVDDLSFAASVARMSEATSGSTSHAAPHVAIARRKTRVTALLAHAGYMLNQTVDDVLAAAGLVSAR